MRPTLDIRYPYTPYLYKLYPNTSHPKYTLPLFYQLYIRPTPKIKPIVNKLNPEYTLPLTHPTLNIFHP